MTQAASDSTEKVLRQQVIASRSERAPMFGHRSVGWGRHAGAAFGAAFVSSSVQTLLALAAGLIAMRMTGAGSGPYPITAVAIVLVTLWIPLFLLVLAQIGIFFTLARGLLMMARCNFGAAYVALGLVMGMVEASVLGAMKGAMLPRDFLFAAATGMLAGFVYWLIASRDREVVAVDARAAAAETFR